MAKIGNAKPLDPIELSLFVSRLEGVCSEMGAVLQRSAFSPNIKDRLDFSCAIFSAAGDLCAQAAHIPVHLGSMAYAMADIVGAADWAEGDMIVLNDPYLGGTHLPDVTVIAPVYYQGELQAFVANRAHHADIGADSPGSMPLSSSLEEEGVVIPPTRLVKNGELQTDLLDQWFGNKNHGDFVAQVSASHIGVDRLSAILAGLGGVSFSQAEQQLQDYGETLASASLKEIPNGEYRFTDYMDDDGQGQQDIGISIAIAVKDGRIAIDFNGTAPQVAGNINCPLPVAAAAVFYVFRCLMADNVPVCAGLFRHIQLQAPLGSLVNARRPAAVSAGNVETSTRITDVVLGALAQAIPDHIPAASHGSMNNLAMGSAGDENGNGAWSYYETIGGGMGASRQNHGVHCVQTHMTNTLNTPIEVLESEYPIRVDRYAVRAGSGGAGRRTGGNGIIREMTFLKPAQATLLTERRRIAPWGTAGGEAGQCGENRLNGSLLDGKVALSVKAGDRLSIFTPGGGGYGEPLETTEQ